MIHHACTNNSREIKKGAILLVCEEGGRERGKEGEREGGKEGEREGRREQSINEGGEDL